MVAETHGPERAPNVSIIRRARFFAEQLAEHAESRNAHVDYLSLFLQLALHLPRFESEFAMHDEVIYAEGTRLRDRLASMRRETVKLVPRWTRRSQLAEFTLTPISDEIAKPILDCYHYLMSFRPRSTHLGLTLKGEEWPWVLVSLSPFDLDNVTIGQSEGMESTLVLSRVYAFPQAPKNAISFTLSKVRRWLATHRPDVTALVTYCNPNLGFRGASYKADNWQLLGYEHGTRYAYLHGNYVTDRRIAELLGDDPVVLSSGRAGRDISFSMWPLESLRLYIRTWGRRTGLWGSEPRHFERWIPVQKTPKRAAPGDHQRATLDRSAWFSSVLPLT
jgi:hypothetical protein